MFRFVFLQTYYTLTGQQEGGELTVKLISVM